METIIPPVDRQLLEKEKKLIEIIKQEKKEKNKILIGINKLKKEKRQ